VKTPRQARKNSTVPPGRPTKLTPALADRLVELFGTGATTKTVAAEVGVHPRSVQGWRRRAWSARPEDRPYVELEQRIQRALPPVEAEPDRPTESVEEAIAWLQTEAPERWGLDYDDFDDVFRSGA
jgi:hypothetical protein